MWLGDYTEDHTTVTCMFTTHSSTGAPVAPNSAFEAADVIIFKNGSATEKTTTNGVTMTSPFNSTTGLHCVVIDTSNDTGDGGFWVAGAVYTLVLASDETVDGVAVAKVIGQFGIELSGALRPTTASRKLDVSAGGEAGIDWANIGSPTTTQDLSGTTIATTQKVDVNTIKTNAVVNGGTLTFPSNATLASTTNITAGTVTTATNVTTVNGLANNVITAASINDGAITAAKIADGAIDAATFASGALDAVWSVGTRSLTVLDEDSTTLDLDATIRAAVGLSSANLDTQLSTIDGIVDDILTDTAEIGAAGAGLTNINLPDQTMNITGNITGNLSGTIGGLTAAALKDFFDTDSTATFGDAVAGSVVKEIADNAGGASLTVQDIVDGVWDEARASHADAGSFGEGVAAIKTKTDSLTFTVAGQVDSNIESVNGTTVNGSGTAGDPWGP